MVGWSRVARLPSFGYEYEIVVTDGDGRLVSRHIPGSSARCHCSGAGCSAHTTVRSSSVVRTATWTNSRFASTGGLPGRAATNSGTRWSMPYQSVPRLSYGCRPYSRQARTQHNGRNARCQAGFVEVAQETFTGLEGVSVDGGSICTVLVGGGLPCTVDDLKRWLGDYLTPPQNRDRSKVRVVVK